MVTEVFQPKRKRLADQVADKLIALIADTTNESGDWLPSEPELMKQFKLVYRWLLYGLDGQIR